MFANLKKKIESEVGDLSRLAPSNVLNRTNSSTLSSRHPSVSSLTSEPPNVSLLATPLSPNPVEFGVSSSSSATPSRSGGGGGGHSLLSIKVKQLEEKLQAQESDFAWRLSTKDDEIGNLNKTIEILTGQLRSQDSEVKKKLVRVQEDIDDLEGFSQQENAKLKHLLLNKEEELGSLRNDVFVKGAVVDELRGKVKSLEVENGRVKVALEKLSGASTSEVDGARFAKEIDELRGKVRSLDADVVRLTAEREDLLNANRLKVGEMEEVNKRLEAKLEEVNTANASLNQRNESLGTQVKNLKSQVDEFEGNSQRVGLELSSVLSEKKSLEIVCGELKGRVKSLEDAVESGVVDVEAKRMEIDTLKATVENLKVLGERSESELAGLRSALEKQQGSSDSGEGELLKLKVKGLEDEVTRLKELEKERSGEVERRELEFKAAFEDVKLERDRLKDINGRLEGEVSNLKAEVDRVKNELVGGFEVEKQGLLSRVSGLEELVAEKGSEVELLRGEVAALEGVKRSAETASECSKARISELEEQLGFKIIELEQARESEGSVISGLNSQIEVLSGNVAELKVLLQSEKDRNYELERTLEVERNSREELNRASSQASESLSSLKSEVDSVTMENSTLKSELEAVRKAYSELEDSQSRALADVVSEWTERVEELKRSCGAEVEAKVSEFEQLRERLVAENAELVRREGEIAERERGALREVQVLKGKCAEVENEKDELIVNVSEVQARVDELEEEVSSLESLRSKVEELEGCVAEKEKQLRQQSHALSDLRRSLAKELKASSSSSDNKQSQQQQQRTDDTNPATAAAIATTTTSSSASAPVVELLSSSSSNSSSNHMNGSVMRSHDAVSLSSSEISNAAAATLPQYETDVNFMYLRSVLFKYLTSSDPQITSHLTRVVATLLHLDAEETSTLMQSMESKTNQRILSHIIK